MLLGAIAGSQAMAAAKPNIVFVLADDLGYGDLGINGQLDRAAQGLPAISTPNLDALASQGLRFTNMYSNPVCSPSRASMLTGFHQAHSLIDRASHSTHIRRDDVTWGQMLKEEGYATAFYGKWHVGGILGETITNADATPKAKGFDRVYGTISGGYRNLNMWQADDDGALRVVPGELDPSWTGPGGPRRFVDDQVTDHVKAFIRDKSASAEPFAAYVAFQTPHTPFNEFPITSQYADKPWTDSHKQYASMITHLDENVQQIRNALNDPNGDGNSADSVANDTLFIFASDNGPLWPGGAPGFDPEFFNSNSHFKSVKAATEDGGIKVPFIVSWPGVTQPGAVNDARVGTFADVLPTFAEIVGRSTPLGIDGESMLGAIRGETTWRETDAEVWSHPFSFASFNFQGWSVRLGDWKLNFRNSTGTTLHNMANDPSEQNSLASSRPDIVAALQTIAFDEGLGREPIVPHTNFPAVGMVVNDYYTQYKRWQPVGASTDFFAAANWAGGTPNAGVQVAIAGIPEAQSWNTGPADNWLAQLRNGGASPQSLTINANVTVLALEVGGSQSLMELSTPAGIVTTARNGFRVDSLGRLTLDGGTLRTVKRLEILAGGELAGHGVVTGRQSVIAAIPEFQGRGYLEPELINAGAIRIQNNSSGSTTGAGKLHVEGDFRQESDGILHIDIYGAGGIAGIDFDQLQVDGEASLQGTVALELKSGFVPQPGATFHVLNATGLNADGMTLGGLLGYRFHSLISPLSGLFVQYVDADFNRDAVIDEIDFSIWQSNFGAFGLSQSQGDANGDGRADASDFLAWQKGFSYAASIAAAVPEPAALTLLLLGATLVGRRPYSRQGA